MKSVMISIRPKWCELIANGKKTIEVRKTRPKVEPPFKCYIYCTKAHKGEHLYNSNALMNPYAYIDDHSHNGGDRPYDGNVIGEFVCDYICEFTYKNGGFLVNDDISTTICALAKCCLTDNNFRNYSHKKSVYGWHISDLKIYDEPRELSEFKKVNRNCWYADLGLAKRDCTDCKNIECFIQRPPQSWCYVEKSEYNNEIRSEKNELETSGNSRPAAL